MARVNIDFVTREVTVGAPSHMVAATIYGNRLWPGFRYPVNTLRDTIPFDDTS